MPGMSSIPDMCDIPSMGGGAASSGMIRSEAV
jgi:hypothetical protein